MSRILLYFVKEIASTMPTEALARTSPLPMLWGRPPDRIEGTEMSEKAYARVWWVVCTLWLSFSAYAFHKSTSAHGDTPFAFIDRSPPEVPAVALPVQLVLCAIALLLTYLWARSKMDSPPAHRLPVAFFDRADVDLGHVGGKAFQAVSGVILVVVPFLLLLRMGARFLRGDIFFSIRGAPDRIDLKMSGLEHFETRRIYEAAGAVAPGKEGILLFGTDHGPQFYPWLTWVYFLGLVGLSLFMLVLLRALLRNPMAQGARSQAT